MKYDIFNFLRADSLAVPSLLGISWDVTDNSHYWFKQGVNPQIVLVAHIDTITRCNDSRMGNKAKLLELNLKNGVITASDSVLGADDRAGCYTIAKLLDLGCSILLTNFEESGGIGVNQFIKDNPKLLKSCYLFIEFDRQGIDQFVCYHDPDPDLVVFLQTYNINESVGSYSDVKDLSDHFGIHHINLSVAYYNQHSKNEYLDFNALESFLIPKYRRLILDLLGLDRQWLVPEPSISDPYKGYFEGFDWQKDIVKGSSEKTSGMGKFYELPLNIQFIIDKIDIGLALDRDEYKELTLFTGIDRESLEHAVNHGYIYDYLFEYV